MHLVVIKFTQPCHPLLSLVFITDRMEHNELCFRIASLSSGSESSNVTRKFTMNLPMNHFRAGSLRQRP